MASWRLVLQHKTDGTLYVAHVILLTPFHRLSSVFTSLPRFFQECLTPASTIELLEACKKGNPPKMGRWGSLPMNGQVSCEGPHGKTTLKEPAPAPGFMMRKDLDGNVDPATVKRDMHY